MAWLAPRGNIACADLSRFSAVFRPRSVHGKPLRRAGKANTQTDCFAYNPIINCWHTSCSIEASPDPGAYLRGETLMFRQALLAAAFVGLAVTSPVHAQSSGAKPEVKLGFAKCAQCL